MDINQQDLHILIQSLYLYHEQVMMESIKNGDSENMTFIKLYPIESLTKKLTKELKKNIKRLGRE